MSSYLDENFLEKYHSLEYPRIQKNPSVYIDKIIDGVVIKDIDVFCDERGYLIEVMRLNDVEMHSENIKQIICTYAYPGMVKGFHLHSRQEDHLVCVTGMVKTVLYDYREKSPTYGVINEIFMGELSPKAVFIPPGVFHGYKNIGQNVAAIIGLPSLIYDIDDVDERRVDPMNNHLFDYNWDCKIE